MSPQDDLFARGLGGDVARKIDVEVSPETLR